jgi:hypothetical protein
MFKFPGYKRDANQNNTEFISPQLEWPESRVMLLRMWQNRNPYTLLVGMQISTATMESSMEIPQKTRDRTAIQSSDITPGHLPKRA